MARIAVLGGGISGLTSAFYLAKTGGSSIGKIVVIESSKQVGGWLQSSRFDDGTVFEHGPRSIRGARNKAGYASLTLAQDLGLESSILPVKKDHPASKYRYIYAKDQLCLLPSGPGGVIKKIPPFSKPLVSFGWKEPFRKSTKKEDESVHDFFSRRFGDEVASYAISAMCRGIYAGDSKQLSAKSCFADPFKWEQSHGSIVRGALRAKKEKFEVPGGELAEKYKSESWSLWSLRGGLQTMAETLHSTLDGMDRVEVRTEAPCSQLLFSPNGEVKVSFQDESVEEFDHVIASVPAWNLAKLVSTQHSPLSSHLNSIPSVSVGIVNLQFDGEKLPVQALGHLIPSNQPDKVLGCLYDSCSFPGHGTTEKPTTRVSALMGGAWFDQWFGPVDQCKDDVLIDSAMKAVRKHMGIKEDPMRVITRIAKNGIPQYVIGHSNTVDKIFSYVEDHKLPMTLIGASYKGVSINDCVLNSRIAAEGLLKDLKSA